MHRDDDEAGSLIIDATYGYHPGLPARRRCSSLPADPAYGQTHVRCHRLTPTVYVEFVVAARV